MTASFVLDTLLETAIRSGVIAVMVAIALAAFRVKSPGLRHTAWTRVLVVMVALPLVSGWLPTVPLPGWVPAMTTTTAGHLVPDQTSSDPVALAPMPPMNQAGPAVATAKVTSRERVMSAEAAPWAWRDVMFVVWILGAAALLFREGAGWWMASRLARQSRRVTDPEIEAVVYESGRVMTPVVVGLLAPRVLVPQSWVEWGTDTRRMAALHELAHVHRRDPLVAALARVNRSVFWFHPLSWWLERHLARVAERACDEVVVEQVRDSRLYAALLVEMARRLHLHGHRVAWQGIGIVSGHRLEDRIDRVLRGPASRPSRLVRMALGVACALLVAAGAACGTAAAPLAEDPVLTKSIAESSARVAEMGAAMMITVGDLQRQKAIVDQNPADLAATRRLVEMYRDRGPRLIGWGRAVAEQRPYALTLISSDPESAHESWKLTRAQDPEGYGQARALWLAHTSRPGASSGVLAHAAQFFSIEEPALAEELLIKGQVRDPGGPPAVVSNPQLPRRSWSFRLGSLYARAILGVRIGGFNQRMSIDGERARSPFALHARAVLDSTTDDQLLADAAIGFLTDGANSDADIDFRALATTYADRAIALRPNSSARGLRNQIRNQIDEEEARERMIRLIKTPAQEMRDPEFMQLSDELKLKYSNGLLWGPHDAMVGFEQTNSFPGLAKAFLASFERRAHVLLEVAGRTPRSTLTSNVMANVHIALGTIAIRQGKTAEALRHLQQALHLTPPPDPNVKPAPWVEFAGSLGSTPARKLTHALLDAGERESIAAFYEAAAATLLYQTKDAYLAAASDIRAGRMPAAYQRELTRQQGATAK